jgi:hypothetical protein
VRCESGRRRSRRPAPPDSEPAVARQPLQHHVVPPARDAAAALRVGQLDGLGLRHQRLPPARSRRSAAAPGRAIAPPEDVHAVRARALQIGPVHEARVPGCTLSSSRPTPGCRSSSSAATVSGKLPAPPGCHHAARLLRPAQPLRQVPVRELPACRPEPPEAAVWRRPCADQAPTGSASVFALGTARSPRPRELEAGLRPELVLSPMNRKLCQIIGPAEAAVVPQRPAQQLRPSAPGCSRPRARSGDRPQRSGGVEGRRLRAHEQRIIALHPDLVLPETDLQADGILR